MSSGNGHDDEKRRDLDHQLERIWKTDLVSRITKLEEEMDLLDEKMGEMEQLLEKLRESLAGMTEP